jgi:hypothetical protein
MNNKLSDLQNHIFEEIRRLSNEGLRGEELDTAIKRAMAVNELAKTAVANGALMAKCADMLYGIPVSDEVPLIPKAQEETYLVDGKRKALLHIPKGEDRKARG